MKKTVTGLLSIAILIVPKTSNSLNLEGFINKAQEKINIVKKKTGSSKVQDEENKLKNNKTALGIFSSMSGSASGCTAANAKKDPLPSRTEKNCLNMDAFEENPNFTKAFKSTHCGSNGGSYEEACGVLAAYENGCTAVNAEKDKVPTKTLQNCFTTEIINGTPEFTEAFKNTHCSSEDGTYSEQCNALTCTPDILSAKTIPHDILVQCMKKEVITQNPNQSMNAFLKAHCGTKPDPTKTNACKLVKSTQAAQKAAEAKKAATSRKAAAEQEAEEDADIPDSDDSNDIDDSDMPDSEEEDIDSDNTSDEEPSNSTTKDTSSNKNEVKPSQKADSPAPASTPAPAEDPAPNSRRLARR